MAGPRPVGPIELAGMVAPALDARPLLLVSDFDGTLAGLVMDPWGASVEPGARRALRSLAGTPGVVVALLSGRTVPDLAARARVGGAIYLGNHGVERGRLPRHARAESIRTEHDGRLAPYVDDAERLASAVPGLVAEPWLIVERKGPSVAFHYRAAPDVTTAAARVAAAVDRLDPAGRFARFQGRRILELRPPGAAAKGETLRSLVEELRPALTLVLGDDQSDAEAFRVLRDLRSSGATRGLAIAVHARPDLPDPVAETADVALPSPAGTARFLGVLARHVRGERLARPPDPSRHRPDQAGVASARATSPSAHSRARSSSPSSSGPSRPAT
jgi:trehalose 6-phosphate phosphatase